MSVSVRVGGRRVASWPHVHVGAGVAEGQEDNGELTHGVLTVCMRICMYTFGVHTVFSGRSKLTSVRHFNGTSGVCQCPFRWMLERQTEVKLGLLKFYLD